MTKKDYVLIADILHSAKPAAPPQASPLVDKQAWVAMLVQWEWTVTCYVGRLKSLNSLFNADKFTAHCEDGR